MLRNILAAIVLAALTAACGSQREAAVDNLGARPSASTPPSEPPTATTSAPPTATRAPNPTLQPPRETANPRRSRDVKYTQSAHTVARGQTFEMSGTGCFTDSGKPGHYAQIVLQARPQADWSFEPTYISALSDGSWSGTVTVPLDAPLGRVSVEPLCIYESEPVRMYEAGSIEVIEH